MPYSHTYLKKCFECNVEFTTQKQTTKFCSPKCNNLNLYKKRDTAKYNARKRINNTNKTTRERHLKRYIYDANYKLSCVLRARLQAAIKNNHKSGSAIKDLGCSIEELKLHLESKFQPGMTWNNWSRSGWHIDHIVPLAKFNLSNYEELKRACHYTNLQPLWAKDNIVKGDK